MQKVDTGCAQKDYLDIDTEKTLAQYQKFLLDRTKRINKEAEWLLEKKIDLIVCDIASYPLKSAQMARLPSVLIANFTWFDIFSKLPGAEKNPNILKVLHEEYSCATVHFLPQFELENDLISTPRKVVGFMSLKGQCKREELNKNLLIENKTLVFIYLGLYDTSVIQWKNLEKLTNYVFITRDPHTNTLPNLKILDHSFSYADLIASSDVVISKCGYSTLACAFHHNKPVVVCERKEFCEGEKIKKFLLKNNLGVILQPDIFNSCDWENAIKRAMCLSVKNKVPLYGENAIIEKIKELIEL